MYFFLGEEKNTAKNEGFKFKNVRKKLFWQKGMFRVSANSDSWLEFCYKQIGPA